MFCFNANAAKWATIRSDKAVIYADTLMQAPIGYLKKGKKIRVGEVQRNYGKLLPIVVQGRIAYIKITDIASTIKLEQLQSATERVRKSKIKKKNNRLSLIYSGYASFISVDSTTTYSGNSNSGDVFYFSGGGVRGYLQDDKKQTSWRITLDHVATTIDQNEFSVLSLTAEYGYNFVQFENYIFRVYGGGSIIPYTQYSYNDLFTVNGYGFAASTGLEMVFKLNDGIGIHLDAGYQYTKLYYQLPDETNLDKYEPSFNGLKFTAGISYAF